MHELILYELLANECAEDEDDVDDHEHLNGSEPISLVGRVKDYSKFILRDLKTLGMLLVMLLKMLTRTRKTVTRMVILPGTLSGGTRKLKQEMNQNSIFDTP